MTTRGCDLDFVIKGLLPQAASLNHRRACDKSAAGANRSANHE
jgi:hypothetical protein